MGLLLVNRMSINILFVFGGVEFILGVQFCVAFVKECLWVCGAFLDLYDDMSLCMAM